MSSFGSLSQRIDAEPIFLIVREASRLEAEMTKLTVATAVGSANSFSIRLFHSAL